MTTFLVADPTAQPFAPYPPEPAKTAMIPYGTPAYASPTGLTADEEWDAIQRFRVPTNVQVLPEIVVTAERVTPWWVWAALAVGAFFLLSGRAGRRRMSW